MGFQNQVEAVAELGSKCYRQREALHVAVCQAVALLNRAPEVARCAESREARDLLRQALADYADAYMDEPVTERERVHVASKHQRKYTQADLLEAMRTERHACSICVWMVLQEALEPDADDKGLSGWMQEAEERVKNRLAHHRTEAPIPHPAHADGLCWLVELFGPDGNSLGHYHTGLTTLSFESRTTRDPLKAKRYATKRDALLACAGLLHLQGVWRAVEHGFGA